MDVGEYYGYYERGVELLEVIVIIFEMEGFIVVGFKFWMGLVDVIFLDDEESGIYCVYDGLDVDGVWEGDVIEYVEVFDYLLWLIIG